MDRIKRISARLCLTTFGPLPQTAEREIDDLFPRGFQTISSAAVPKSFPPFWSRINFHTRAFLFE